MAGRQKGPEPRRDRRPERRSEVPLHSHTPSLAEASKATRNRMRWFSAELCSGPDQSPSIIYLSSGLGKADSKSLPGVIRISRCSCAALAGGGWEVSLFPHFKSRLSSHAVHPPHPSPGRSSDVVSTRDNGHQIRRPADKGFLLRLNPFSTNRIKTGLQRSHTDGFAFAPFSSFLY